MSREGTVELWCKPETLPNGAVLLGKWGVLNVQLMGGARSIRFSLMPKDGAVTCESPGSIISAGKWWHIKASWGRSGAVLFLNGRVVTRAAFPVEFEWRDLDRHFLLGSYTWPGGYDVWYFDGLIDDFSFKPTQEPLPAESAFATRPRANILKPLLRETPKPNYGVPVPEKVSGHVTQAAPGNADGVAGVSVTDGSSTVKTDAEGRYVLTPFPTRFSSISPSPQVTTWLAPGIDQ